MTRPWTLGPARVAPWPAVTATPAPRPDRLDIRRRSPRHGGPRHGDVTAQTRTPAAPGADGTEPEFVPAALAFGSGIHGAPAFLFRGRTDGTPPSLTDVQAFFEAY